MALSQRYLPAHPPGEVCAYSLDLSAIIPPGVGISSGSLSIVTNTNPVAAAPEWTIGTVTVANRTVTAQAQGGTEGVDYQFRFTATDTMNNVWNRTVLCLCAQTS